MLGAALLALLFVSTTTALCPEYYDLVRDGKCFYQYGTSQYLYAPNALSSVTSYCSSSNADAVPITVHSQEEHDYWFGVAKKNFEYSSSSGNIYLALQCNSKTSKYEWFDGSKVDYVPAKYNSLLTDNCNSNYVYAWYVDPKSGEWKTIANTYLYLDIYCILNPDQNIPAPDVNCYDFNHDDVNDVCYQVGAKAINFKNATNLCTNFDSHLASIHSPDENAFVRRLAVQQGLVNGMYLGGSVKDQTKKWIDDSDFDYDNFAPGFPIEGLGDCIAMETNSVNAPWLNIDCSTELPFVCLRKPQDFEVTCDGSLKKEGDIIRSPGYPSNSSIPCDFLLKVDPGYLVEVEIVNLEANSCCDKLVLTEGTLGGKVIATLTGDKVNGKKYRTTSQNFMRASWQPNGGANVKGMIITFRAIKK